MAEQQHEPKLYSEDQLINEYESSEEFQLEQRMDTEDPGELDELLVALPGPKDDLSDLDALLDESMLARTAQLDAKKARDRLRRGGQSQADRDADIQRIKEWADKYEWEPVATAGVFNRYSCACGNTTTVFDCIMVEEKHKTDRFAKRFINLGVERRSTPRTSEPPRVTVIRELQTAACDKCGQAKGWRLDDATIWRG